MRNAERYLTQGKIEAAISEYREIVIHDPKDINTQNMLGDLYVKVADKESAVNCYRKVADHYHDQGFAKKSIAVYNKIYKLKPELSEVVERLAELYQLRGSIAEARSHYQIFAERLEKENKSVEVLEVWHKIAELDPRDHEICLKIAKIQRDRNQKEDACRAFFDAGLRLAEKGRNEEAVEAFREALKVNGKYWKAVRGQVRSLIQMGTPEKAAELLEEKLREDPYNKEFIFLLIDCYLGMDNAGGAEKIIVRLVEREPANYPKLLELVDIYHKKGDHASAVRILSMLSEHLLAGGDARTLENHLTKVTDSDPENVDGLRLLARCYGWQREQQKLVDTLRRLSAAAKVSGAFADERWALAQYLVLVPHDSERASRLKELECEYGRETSAGGEVLIPADDRPASAGRSLNGAHAFAAQDEFGLESEAEFAATNEDGSGLITHPNDALVADKLVPATVVEAHDAVTVIEDHVSVYNGNGIGSNGNGKSRPEEKFISTPLTPADEVRYEEEIGSIRFYVEQGYESLAEKALDALEVEFGNRVEIAVLRQELSNSDLTYGQFVENAEDAEEAEIEYERVPELDHIRTAEAEIESDPKSTVHDTSEEDPLRRIASDLGLDESETDTDKDADFEDHYNRGVVFREMALVEEAIREFQHAADCVSPDDAARRYYNCCTMLGHCFLEKEMPKVALIWFKRATEAEDLGFEEMQALDYELGNIYDLLDDPEAAIEHFERVYAQDVDFRDIGVRLETLRTRVSVPQ